MAAGEGLDGEMDAFVALEIVVAVEGLGALVAFEGTVVGECLALWVVPVHLRVLRVALHVHSAHERHLVSRVVDVGHDGPGHGW